MPTAKPRVMVTLEPEMYEMLGRLAKISNTSMAGVVRDILASFEPMIETAVRLRQKADEARERIVSIPPELDQQALRMQREVLDLLAGLETALTGSTEVTPVHVIRGSEQPGNPTKPRKGGSRAHKI